MAEFTNDDLGLRFTVPDKVPVRLQLRYRSQIGLLNRGDTYERYWEGAKELIDKWECDVMEDYNVSLDDETDPKIADIIFWACNAVAGHMDRLGVVEKNS